MVEKVEVRPKPDTEDNIYEVDLYLCVPDVETDETTSTVLVQEYCVSEKEIRKAGTAENAVVIRALRDSWEHEFKEGVWIDGKAYSNPEPDHARGRQYNFIVRLDF